MRKGNMLAPHTAESDAIIAKLPLGKPIKVTAKRPRNSKHAALYWVMCSRIADAIGADDVENVSDTLKIATGHVRLVQSKTYGTLRLPKSISFAAMDQTKFSEFFERCIFTVTSEWGIARKDILDVLSDLIDTEGKPK